MEIPDFDKYYCDVSNDTGHAAPDFHAFEARVMELVRAGFTIDHLSFCAVKPDVCNS